MYHQAKSILFKSNPVLDNQIRRARQQSASSSGVSLTYGGDVEGVDFSNVVVKPYLPKWLYRPMFGRPRCINVPEIRRLMLTPTPAMCIKTIVDQVSSVPWQISMVDDKPVNEAVIDEVTKKLRNPNRNKECLKQIIKKLSRDILGVDSGVIVKVFDLQSYEGANPAGKLLPIGRRRMLEFYVYDGATFTVNPDEHGILPDQHAYYQYNYSVMARPTPFARDEIIFMVGNDRTDDVYGFSAMQTAYDLVLYVVHGVNSGLDHFNRNEIPKGILQVIDGEKEDIKAFKERLSDRVRIQDSNTDQERWVSSSIPIINQEVKFTPIQLTPETVRLLETQQWYVKLILACFGVTSSELGFTEDSNRATEIVQSEVFRRKTVLPMLDLIEQYFNSELIPEFGYDDIKFEFVREDMGLELREQTLWNDWLKNGQMTVNEWRQSRGDLEPVDWGDEPVQSQKPNTPFGSIFNGVDRSLGDD